MPAGTVALEGMEFFAYHGYYAEEREVGNKYTVDISVHTDFTQAADSDELEGTINYEVVYKLVKAQMKIPTKLLESLAKRIIDSVLNELPNVNEVSVSVAKHNPPIGGVCAKSIVTLTQSRK